MEFALNTKDLTRILWRRKWFFLLPASLVCAIVAALILVLPPVFRSEATILIQQQNIPENFVPSLVTDYIDRRLDVLTKQILVSDNLARIAEQYKLYPEDRAELSRTQLAERMRGRIETRTILTDFNDPATGRSGESTLAFQVSFADGNPQTAQRVTNELVSAYMGGNLETRRAVVEQTTNFFAAEREALDRQVRVAEDELTAFQTINRDVLPEEAAVKRQMLSNLEQELRLLNSSWRTLRERQSFLATQLALTPEFDSRPVGGPGGPVTPESQLELLRADLATARARYSSEHPDVVRLSREVRSLERVVGARSGGSALAEQEAAITADLSAARERYTAEHPDVRRLERELATVRRAVAEGSGARSAAARSLRSPTYVQISAELNSVEAEISSIEQYRTELVAERAELQEQLSRAPVVEQEYLHLRRQLDTLLEDRRILAGKEESAELSGSLEAQAMSEQFVLVEPPVTPLAPVSPKKKLILALGLVLAAGSGTVGVILAELFDQSIRGARDLRALLGDAPLAVIPNIVSARQRRWIWRYRAAGLVLACLIVVAVLFGLHTWVAPLDVLGYQVANEAEAWVRTTFPGVLGSDAALPAN